MSATLLTLIVAVVFLAVSFLIMAVGLLRGKTFTSCGCASITYKGEKIRCAACPEPAEGACPEPAEGACPEEEGESCADKGRTEDAG